MKVTFGLFIACFFTLPQLFAQLPEIKWHFDADDMAFGNAALADVDGDGLPEIAFSTYRNDERIIVLNAEDGSLLWEYHTGGCNDVAPLIYDVDMDGELEIVLPGSCNPRTFCFDAATGELEWETEMHGSDSPPTVADVDNDGKPEILHGEFNGWIICLNGEDGSIVWEFNADPNSWIQTAPTILDVDNDGQLDFVVANWSFGDEHRLFAFRGHDHSFIWESELPNGVIYHGASHADIDGDGKPELVIGDYSGQLLVINAEDGSLLWDFSFPTSWSVAAPTHIADLNGDGNYEIVLIDWYQLGVLDKEGNLIWQFDIPNNASAFRGCAISDVDNDDGLDLVFGTSDGKLYGLDGAEGTVLWMVDLRADIGESDFSIDHGPVIADFDDDGMLDVFMVGGHAEYPDVHNNYGRAYAVSLESPGGPDWPMFRRDVIRSACVCDINTTNEPNLPASDPNMLLYYDAERQAFKLESEFTEEYVVHLYDLHGSLLIRQILSQAGEINVASLPAGMYIFTIASRNKHQAKGRVMKY